MHLNNLSSGTINAISRIRDGSYQSKLQASGVLEGACCHPRAWDDAVLTYRGSGFIWRTLVNYHFNCCEIAWMLMAAHAKQKKICAIFIGSTDFWRVTIQLCPPLNARDLLLEVERLLKRVTLKNPDTITINSLLRGLGHAERCRYVVVEDPSIVRAFDFFRKNKCDLDFIKLQVYGANAIYVPETFPACLPTLENVLSKCLLSLKH